MKSSLSMVSLWLPGASSLLYPLPWWCPILRLPIHDPFSHRICHSLTIFSDATINTLQLPRLENYHLHAVEKFSNIFILHGKKSIRGLRRRKTSTSSSTWEEDAKKNKDRSEYQEDDAEDYCYRDLPLTAAPLLCNKKEQSEILFLLYEGKEYLAFN